MCWWLPSSARSKVSTCSGPGGHKSMPAVCTSLHPDIWVFRFLSQELLPQHLILSYPPVSGYCVCVWGGGIYSLCYVTSNVTARDRSWQQPLHLRWYNRSPGQPLGQGEEQDLEGWPILLWLMALSILCSLNLSFLLCKNKRG